METTKPTPLNHGIKYGLILGFIQIAMTLLIYTIDKTALASWWLGLCSLVIVIIMVVIPIKAHKKLQDGIISFKDAFLISFYIGVFSLILGSVFNYLLYNVIDPSLADTIRDTVMEKTSTMMEKFGAREEDIAKALEGMQDDFVQTPGRMLKQFIGVTIFYSIISLIVAAIMRTKTQPVDDIQ